MFQMSQFVIRLSAVLSLAALCVSGIKIESNFDVADQNSNVYIPTCTEGGMAKDFFWNFNNCTTCGFNCVVKGGDSVYNKVAATLTSTLVDPVVATTFHLDGIQVGRSISVMTANFSANQLYAVETWATVPVIIFPRLCKVTFEVTPKGQPDNRLACGSCEFRLV